jgi:hypothetical protein
MANPFDTPILTRANSVRRTVVPQFADADFWSVVLHSRRDIVIPPPGTDFLVTDAGIEFVDELNNELVATF